MTAKEFLNQTFEWQSQIDELQAKLTELRQVSESLSTVDYTRDRVTGSPIRDYIGEMLTRIISQESQLDTEINRLNGLKSEIRKRLNYLPAGASTVVLKKRYLHNQAWGTIAAEMNFTRSYVMQLHKRGLRIFTEMNPDMLEGDE